MRRFTAHPAARSAERADDAVRIVRRTAPVEEEVEPAAPDDAQTPEPVPPAAQPAFARHLRRGNSQLGRDVNIIMRKDPEESSFRPLEKRSDSCDEHKRAWLDD